MDELAPAEHQKYCLQSTEAAHPLWPGGQVASWAEVVARADRAVTIKMVCLGLTLPLFAFWFRRRRRLVAVTVILSKE